MTRDVSPDEPTHSAPEPPQPGVGPTSETLAHAPVSVPDALLLQPGAEPVPGYVLMQSVGRGGFGEVWKAQGPGGFPVALKFIPLAENSTAVELRALEIMKQVQHPHLLPMFGAWQKVGTLVIAMELARCTLADRLKQVVAAGQPGIPFTELVDYLRDAARALDYLNDQNIQHRDVKPHNLMLVGDGVKIADFGLAKMLENTIGPASGSMTPTYAPPELFDNQVTRWSDQYSLAITYCHLRGNQLPFKGSAVQLMIGHMDREPDLSMLPDHERTVVRRALAKRPEERWPSSRKFAEALANALAPAASVGARDPQQQRSETPAAPVRPFELKLRPLAPLTLKPGTQHSYPVQVERLHCPGKLELRLESLPAGITFQSEGIKPDSNEGRIELAIAADVRPWSGNVRVVVRGSTVAQADVPCTIEPPSWTPIITNFLSMKLAIVPAGSFQMGSTRSEEGHRMEEDPIHEIQITRPFYLGIYPVTQTQYELLMGYNPAFFTREKGGAPDHPVEQVNWHEAMEFCQRLSEMPQEKQAKRVYRLPTEAEWEYACRAGTKTATAFGPHLNSAQANFNGNFPYGHATKGTYRFRTAKVGSYKPNPWGLYDMHGNVWEWCWDWYDAYYYGYCNKRDPKGGDPNAENRRVIRGGSWYDHGHLCRSACRGRAGPKDRAYTIGFRIVLDVVPGMGC